MGLIHGVPLLNRNIAFRQISDGLHNPLLIFSNYQFLLFGYSLLFRYSYFYGFNLDLVSCSALYLLHLVFYHLFSFFISRLILRVPRRNTLFTLNFSIKTKRIGTIIRQIDSEIQCWDVIRHKKLYTYYYIGTLYCGQLVKNS